MENTNVNAQDAREASVKKPARKQIKLPTKRTLNLLLKEKSLSSPSRLLPILVIIIAVTYLFSKYAVAGRLEQVNLAEAELATARKNLELIENAFADYDEVAEQYSHYSYENFDKTVPDRVEVLKMLENRLFPICTIQSLTINGRDIDMVVADVDLKTLTYINGMLQQEEPMIESVKIASYTDNSDEEDSENSTATATVSIRLADASSTYNPDQLEFDPDAIIAEGEDPNTDTESEPKTSAEAEIPENTESEPEVTENGGAE